MLFFKSKQSDELLPPPPPPFPEFEEEMPKSSNELIKLTNKIVTKKEKITSKKKSITKKAKIQKKDLKKPIYGKQILEDFDIDIEKELMQETKAKPKEVLEAEEEIKSAIDKIKEREKISFFKKFFPIKQRPIEKPMKDTFVPVLPELGKTSIIQAKINEAKQALMKFDLESAKRNYLEILKIYNGIKPEEQAKVYQDIRDLYFERKSAEELKV